MAAEYRKTRYPNVYWRGDVLYVTHRSELVGRSGGPGGRGGRKKVMTRFGKGSPAQALAFQQRLQREADAVRAGEVTRAALVAKRESTRPIDDLIERYRAHLEGLGRSKKHVDDTERMQKRWAKECRISVINDASAERLAAWLTGLEQDEDKPASARTVNAYRVAVLALMNWASDFGLVERKPISSRMVKRRNERDNRVRVSRVMALEQVRALLTCEKIPIRRRTYYAVGVLMGVRWKEIERVRWEHLDLSNSTLTMPGSITKNKKPAQLPIPAALVAMLRELQGTKGARLNAGDGRALGVQPNHVTWVKDLIRAGVCGRDKKGEVVGYADERGYVFERKCLRHTFQVTLKRLRVNPDDRRDLMRHAGFALMDTSYNEPRMSDLQRVVDDLGATILQPESGTRWHDSVKNANKGGDDGPRLAGAG